MNNKFKRSLAIFSLAFIIIATVMFVPYLITLNNPSGAVTFIFYISAALGLGTGVPLIILNSSEKKAEARRKLYEDIERAEEEKARREAAEAEAQKLERAELDRKINLENNKK